MPEGDPKRTTIATAKYQRKNGIIAKSYKIRKELADEFASTCDKLGVGKAATISRLMQEFIDQHK